MSLIRQYDNCGVGVGTVWCNIPRLSSESPRTAQIVFIDNRKKMNMVQ